MLIGYMRVSSGDERQSVALQRDALLAAGVDQRHLHQDRASGARDDRPGLKACLTELCEGDVLVVWKLDRLGRSLSHLIRIVEDLKIRGVALCLAALYESWTIPIAVLLAMPVGVLGALLGAVIGDQTNGVYFQVGLLTVVGLTGKNGIMIVEFARERMAHTGGNAVDAVLEAAKLRFRPILMTSLAFGLGVVPLIISSGAGAGARHAIGYATFFGTVTGTVLAVIFVPVFFVVVNKIFNRASKTATA
ncbi:efflux RND transporter permease subunit [Agrobacterium sp. S2/73]|nr:efflux RND transporter permease subunit [Agrobacterium sp. S2/73]QXZ76234.1 efflux RND transporter permease subunit [Agrobacterium sp. S7/73]QYA17218.1 efflux RND transporter permease subunit [Rhizobium sp. AB2/73]UEQ85208.1 efflux RND transporter permease subunit [Rhizobium sp. AB2/73]